MPPGLLSTLGFSAPSEAARAGMPHPNEQETPMRNQSPTGVPPLPLEAIEQRRDPTYGYGAAVYSLEPDTTALFRYQTCRRFDGRPWRAAPDTTLVVLGL